MIVCIPSPLRSYTGNKSEVQITASTLKDLLSELDREYPGVRFRMIDEQDQIRQHIKIFINKDEASSLDRPLAGSDVVRIICALSGG